jgi:hypothetical protein
MKKGFTETGIFMPLRVGGEVSPIRGPMADEFVVFGRSSCRKPCDPRIDPSDSIRDIRTVDRNLMADEEIFGQIGFNPSGEIRFFLHSPATITYLPNLRRRFLRRFSKRRCSENKEDGEDEYHHKIILRVLLKNCQPKQNIQNLLTGGQSFPVQLI